VSTSPATGRGRLSADREALLAQYLAGLVEDSQRITPLRPGAARPLSFAQQRLWFLDRLQPGGAEYTASIVLRLTGRLDAPALRQALGAVVARHEVLRTTITTSPEGVATQTVHPPACLALPCVDVSELPGGNGAAGAVELVRRLIEADVWRSFDLARDVPLRARLVRLAADEHVLAIAVHHIAFDEWSQEILHRELWTQYAAFQGGAPATLAPPPIQYADYAAWQREWLAGDVLERELDYWRVQLADLRPVTPFTGRGAVTTSTGRGAGEPPADRPREAALDEPGAVLAFEVPPATTAALNALARQARASLFMVLLAACQVWLARHTGQPDVVIGTPVANRAHPDTQHVVGLFVNTLVLRSDVSGDPTFGELLASVRRTALDAYAHQELPFERLVDALQPQRDRTRTPLFQVMLAVHPEQPPDDDGGLGGLGVCNFPIGRTAAKFDLAINVHESRGALHGSIAYHTGLFDAATVERLAERLTTLLAAIADDPSRRLRDLPVLTPA